MRHLLTILFILVLWAFARTAFAEDYLLDKIPTGGNPAGLVGPWPEGIPIPKGFYNYTPTAYAQSIATVNDRPSIRAELRRRLLPKWQVPGGMEGVTGFRSDLYRNSDSWAQEWYQRMPVKNSFGFYQLELGVRRAYADGSVFLDVLSHNGKVFELRVAEKQRGEWRRYVAFKDVDARPKGYAGLKGQTCAECHKQTATGDYGLALVPGGDTVISVPFDYFGRQ